MNGNPAAGLVLIYGVILVSAVLWAGRRAQRRSSGGPHDRARRKLREPLFLLRLRTRRKRRRCPRGIVLADQLKGTGLHPGELRAWHALERKFR